MRRRCRPGQTTLPGANRRANRGPLRRRAAPQPPCGSVGSTVLRPRNPDRSRPGQGTRGESPRGRAAPTRLLRNGRPRPARSTDPPRSRPSGGRARQSKSPGGSPPGDALPSAWRRGSSRARCSSARRRGPDCAPTLPSGTRCPGAGTPAPPARRRSAPEGSRRPNRRRPRPRPPPRAPRPNEAPRQPIRSEDREAPARGRSGACASPDRPPRGVGSLREARRPTGSPPRPERPRPPPPPPPTPPPRRVCTGRSPACTRARAPNRLKAGAVPAKGSAGSSGRSGPSRRAARARSRPRDEHR